MPHACRTRPETITEGLYCFCQRNLSLNQVCPKVVFFLGGSQIFQHLSLPHPTQFQPKHQFQPKLCKLWVLRFSPGIGICSLHSAVASFALQRLLVSRTNDSTSFYNLKKGEKKTLPNFDYICKIKHTFNLCY